MRQIAFALALLLSGTANAQTLQLLTEEYPPYNFSKDGVISGAAVEQAELMMKATGTPYSLEILPGRGHCRLRKISPDLRFHDRARRRAGQALQVGRAPARRSHGDGP